MIFTIGVFLIPYAILLVVWIILSLLITWNLFAYVKEIPASGLLIIAYLVGSAVLLAVSWFFISAIDWGTPLNLISYATL